MMTRIRVALRIHSLYLYQRPTHYTVFSIFSSLAFERPIAQLALGPAVPLCELPSDTTNDVANHRATIQHNIHAKYLHQACPSTRTPSRRVSTHAAKQQLTGCAKTGIYRGEHVRCPGLFWCRRFSVTLPARVNLTSRAMSLFSPCGA